MFVSVNLLWRPCLLITLVMGRLGQLIVICIPSDKVLSLLQRPQNPGVESIVISFAQKTFANGQLTSKLHVIELGAPAGEWLLLQRPKHSGFRQWARVCFGLCYACQLDW